MNYDILQFNYLSEMALIHEPHFILNILLGGHVLVSLDLISL